MGGDDIRDRLRAASGDYARAAWQRGDVDAALEFLDGLEVHERPRDIEEAVCLECAKRECETRHWGRAIEFAERAAAAAVNGELPSRRLAVLRRRRDADLTDDQFELMLDDPEPLRLPADALCPEVDAALAVGTYVARNTPSRLTELLRVAKRQTGEPRDGATRLLVALLSRYVAEYTDFLAVADLVAAVPADPDRWLERDRRSLPDALGRGLEAHCGVPYEPDVIARTPGRDVKMSELGHAARRREVRGLYQPGSRAPLVAGRAVLVVDDITTSGATLRECGRVLKQAGATYVFAVAIAHTEG